MEDRILKKVRTDILLNAEDVIFSFIKKVKHSEMPEHALTYKGETKFARSELTVPKVADETETPIFLLYPWPRTVSHTDAKFQDLFPADSVAGITLMDAELLRKTILELD